MNPSDSTFLRTHSSEIRPSSVISRRVVRDVAQRDPQTFAVIGAAMAVHSELGRGFLERVYDEALTMELGSRGIPFAKEVDVPVRYKGHTLTTNYRADLICFPMDRPVLVELKAVERLTHAHRAQVIHYLKATQIHRALLMNFGTSGLQFERMVLGWKDVQIPPDEHAAPKGPEAEANALGAPGGFNS